MPQPVHPGDMGSEAEASRGLATTSLSEGEVLADERDRKADQREALTDERERGLDERERGLDERERGLDERERAIKAFVKRIEEESLDLIERGKQEQAVTGTAAGSKPHRVAAPADLKVPTERAAALREQLRAMLAVLVATEEEVAGVLDKIAAGQPDNTDQYWRTAAEARTRARQLREIEQHFHD